MEGYGAQVLRFLSLQDANVRWVVGGLVLLGISSGVLGSFTLLRKQSLVGDALAHAALPGLCVAFMISGSKSVLPLLCGAAASGVLGSLAIGAMTRFSRIKHDTALGIVLSVFFGMGIVLLTMIQNGNYPNPSGLNTFLFGKAASLIESDLKVMSGTAAVLVLTVFALFKEFQVISFDADFAGTAGLPVRVLDLLLAGLIIFAVVIGLQAVGVVLMAAILITPAAAARQWTDNLARMVVIAAVLGALSGILGAFLSFLYVGFPTGPLMVLSATVVFVISILFAPSRGIVRGEVRRLRNRRRVFRENILKTIYLLGERGGRPLSEGVSVPEISEERRYPVVAIQREVDRLRRDGLLVAALGASTRRTSLTEKGIAEARRIVRNHRLWEAYLVERASIAADHVHRDAEMIEHVLPAEMVERLEAGLGAPAVDPHGRAIPARSTEATSQSEGRPS